MTDTEHAMTDAESDSRESDAADDDSVDRQSEDRLGGKKSADSLDDETSADGPDENKSAEGPDSKKSLRLRLSISVRGLVIVAVAAALIGTIGTLAWLYVGAQRKVDAEARQSANNAHAEKVALDYAVSAAAMNFEDLNAWKVKLVAGTTPELKDKLTKAATSMEQIIVPLQWTSTARPLVAKVRSHTAAVYVVDSFVSVETKTMQAPDPLQSTAAYSITIDTGKDWKITDVGGIGAVVDEK
jgi:Mce-associated membrane protein